MKTIKHLFIVMLMTTIVNVYPYTQEQFENNIANEYQNILVIAKNCKDPVEGEKTLDSIYNLCVKGIMPDAQENGSSDWPKKELWMKHLLEKKDDNGRTLKEIASSNTPLGKKIHNTLDQIEKSLY